MCNRCGVTTTFRLGSTLSKKQKEALASGPDFEDFLTGDATSSEGYTGNLKYKRGEK